MARGSSRFMKVRSAVARAAHFRTGAGTHGGGKGAKRRRHKRERRDWRRLLE